MKYKQLGRTGVRVSTIGIGTATLGVAPLEKEADRIVGRALELGINVLDCANSYGNQPRFDRPTAPPANERPSAEEILGKVLRGGRRKEVVLSSKVMERVGPGVNDCGLSRRHIFQQLEESLRRLQTDHIDLYYAHHPDATTPIEETVRAFDDLVRQGKIRYGALSTYTAWQLVDAQWKAERLGAQPFCAVQTPYNLTARGFEADLIPAALAHSVSMIVFSPLAGGILANRAVRQREFGGAKRWGGRDFTAEQIEIADQLEKMANETGHRVSHLALAWLAAQPVVASAIMGAETLEELEENAAAGDVELTPEVLAAVNEINKPGPPRFGG